jgi:hypothetical protein
LWCPVCLSVLFFFDLFLSLFVLFLAHTFVAASVRPLVDAKGSPPASLASLSFSLGVAIGLGLSADCHLNLENAKRQIARCATSPFVNGGRARGRPFLARFLW